MAAERDPLENQVYHHLLQRVSSQELKPGTFVRAGSLAKNLNVSRTTVRKALVRLASDGWMEQTPEGYTSAPETPSSPASITLRDDGGLNLRSQIESTYWRIFDWILQGTCGGGDNVLPREFADRFSVSVGTVRLALDWLTQDGILVRAPRRGWRYRSLTLPDIVDTIEIRTMLEVEVLRRAGARISKPILEHLRCDTERVLERIDSLSERERRQADYDFHTTLMEQSTSAVLIDLIKPLVRRSLFVGMSCPPEKRHQARSFREHLAMLEALRSENDVQAIEILQSHLRRALVDSISPLQQPSSLGFESASLETSLRNQDH